MRNTIIAASVLLLFSACKKDLLVHEVVLNREETSSKASVSNEFSNCKLRSIYHDRLNTDGSILKVKGNFSYNAAGNPFSLRYTYQGVYFYGMPTYYFLYDNQKRLRELRLTYNDGEVISTINKYGYNSNGQIVVDTTIIKSDPGIPDDITVSTLTYDNQGRIVKEAIRNIQTAYVPIRPTRYPTYTYDNRGNLGVSGWKSSSYDYKVSLFRAHPLFMFLHRNFSKNNAAPQAKYNSVGLPLSMNPGNDLFFRADKIDRITYDCQ